MRTGIPYRVPAASGKGFTLMELVASMTVLSIIAMVASNIVIESMKAYTRAVPSMDLTYRTELALRTLLRDIRDISAASSISSFTSSSFAFKVTGNLDVAYALDGSDLTRNGDLLASDVSSLSFTYLAVDGSVASQPEDLHLVEVDITLTSGSQAQQAETLVFPRNLGLPL